tara:strand:- start:29 stop:667 length:639 start_codon:yes stop_codon:yes gene_type:complete
MKVINDKELEAILKNSTYWKHLSPGQLIWIIGIMEGEGYFTSRIDKKKHVNTTIGCQMTDEIVINRLQEYLGGRIYTRQRDYKKDPRCKNPQKPSWVVYIRPHPVNERNRGANLKRLSHHYKYRELLEIIKPYFCDRRKQQIEKMQIYKLIYLVKQRIRFLREIDLTAIPTSTKSYRLIKWRKEKAKNEAINKMDSRLCDIVPKRFSFKNQN